MTHLRCFGRREWRSDACMLLGLTAFALVSSVSDAASVLGKESDTCAVAPASRFDCAPEKGIAKEECEARGCCYSPAGNRPGIGQPWCFFPSTYPSYKLTNKTETEHGFTATLVRSKETFMPNDIMTVQLVVSFETEDRLHFTIKDPAQKRYEVPIRTPCAKGKAANTHYDVQITADPFSLVVKRKSNGQEL